MGDDGGQGHAGHVHLKDDHKDQIQDHVDDSGEGEKVQRPLGVPLGPKDGGPEIVDKIGGQAQEIDAQVHSGQVDDIGGGGHPLQQLPGHSHAKCRHNNAAGQGQGHGGVDTAAHIVVPPRPQVPGHHHVSTH